MSADLVAFFRARLDEDERIARDAFAAPWLRHDHVAGVHADDAAEGRPYGTAVADCRRVPDGYGVPNALHIARHQPARVLAEVEVKRRIAADYAAVLEAREGIKSQMSLALREDPDEFGRLHQRESEFIRQLRIMGPVICLLALPYADHPDYREEWRP
ncbi:DUF6221 family protein [Streptomyces sp. NPDC051173]|uniref:DUF6221 family protein n=1 Tax=Streptomyces sp. NPDC051173 TaxID=3155164 RepID=UPI00344C0049